MKPLIRNHIRLHRHRHQHRHDDDDDDDDGGGGGGDYDDVIFTIISITMLASVMYPIISTTVIIHMGSQW